MVGSCVVRLHVVNNTLYYLMRDCVMGSINSK